MSLSTKVLFFCFSSLLLLPCQKTLVFRFFSINSQVILKNSRPLASNFSILLSNLLKKISIQEFYDTETTTARRKQKNKTLVDRKQLFLNIILDKVHLCNHDSDFFPWQNYSLLQVTTYPREDARGVASETLATPFFQDLFHIPSGLLAIRTSGHPVFWPSDHPAI